MSSRPARFSGRVQLFSGAPAYGCRVVLTVGEARHTVVETWTSSQGDFLLTVPPGRVAAGESAAEGFTLEVIDGTGAVLAERTDLVARPGSTTHVSLVSDTRTMVTLPLALPLIRAHHAAILRPEAMAVIEAALGLLAPLGSSAHERYQAAVRRVLPPPGHVEELLDLAWSALDGDPAAMDDLREILAVQAATMRLEAPLVRASMPQDDEPRRSRHHAYGQPRDAGPRAPQVEPATLSGRLLAARATTTPDNEPRSGVESAVSTDRLLPLLVAVVRVSRSAGERVAFFDALHGVLSGLFSVDRLHRAALDVLQERRVAQLRALLALLMAEGGDETDLPLPMPGGVGAPGGDPLLPDLIDPWWERLRIGIRATQDALQEARRGLDAYVVARVEPEDAAPGTVVRLLGSGFGAAEGSVVFTAASPVEALRWSDTELEVQVPDDAAPGPVSLRILQGIVPVGRKLVEVYREGTAASFTGGRPQLRSVLVDGKAPGAWVRPSDPVAVSWTAISGSAGSVAMQVQLRDPEDPERLQVLFDDSELPPSGSRIVAVPDVDREHELVLRLRVENPVDIVRRELVYPVAIPPRLRIEGVEVTQGVQRDPRGDEPPVATVAGRDTFVRVYVSADREGFQDDRVRLQDAHLRVGDLTLPPWPRSADDEAFEAGRASAIDRSRPDHALLFRIPAAACEGTRELQVEVTAPGRPPNAPRAEARLTWTWTAVRPLPVRYVRVRTDDAHGAPLVLEDAEARETLARAFDLLPTPPEDIGPAWLDVLDAPGDVASGDTGAWDKVLDQLASMRDGTAWEWALSSLEEPPPADPEEVWVGLLPLALPDQADPRRRAALVPLFRAQDGPTSSRRIAGARALATALGEGPGSARLRVTEVPWDPHFTTTVDDAQHGLRDLAAPPGASWISPERWQRLLGRM